MPLDSGPALIVDDDVDSRAFIASLLRRLGYSTHEVATGEAALEAAQREPPGLVFLEVRLPDTSGYEVCRELRDEFGEGLPIVFVSSDRTEPSDQVAGLLVGADDYLVKPFAPDELLARVRRLLARSKPSPSAMVAGLTKREHEVLSLLAEGSPQPEIASRLSVSPKTVGKHIEHILRKLGVHSRTEAVAFALRTGVVGSGRAPHPSGRDGDLPGRDPGHEIEERPGDSDVEQRPQKRQGSTLARRGKPANRL
jgi:two-component system, NarL family, nitrate/nitrite response regulator NarL